MLVQLGLGQSARHQQPPVISHDTNAFPARVAKLHHPLKHLIQLRVHVTRQTDAVLVPIVVQVTRFNPGQTSNITGFVFIQRLNAVLT